MVRRTTDPRSWERVDEIFAAAIALPESDRGGYVDSACAGDEALREQLQGLLLAHARTGVLDQLGERIVDQIDAALPEPPVPEPGGRIGPYQVGDLLGHGGMGVVYLAHREGDGFEQRAAIKVLRAGSVGRDMVARFLAERRILALLEHPNITRFLDGGLTANGAPYFAMEYVQGTPLDKYCDERRLGIRQRLALFVSVCDAIQYAHRHLVVHRDLKPSNVLVTPDGVVKVLDFGIAKLLDAPPDEAGLTGTGQRWMTPDYASPEQIRGEAVTTATDVFALGVVLYELLCGVRPHSGAARHLVEQAILDLEPARPSAACGDKARETRGIRTGRRCRELAGDLDTITLKALDKSPGRRYGSAGELADDIRRHLAGLPVRARPDTLAYRARKFVARHRRFVAAGVVAAVAIVALVTEAVIAERRIRVNAAQARLERDRAEQVSRFVVGLFEGMDPMRPQGAEVTARELLDSGAARIRRELADQPANRAALLEVLAQSYDGLGRYPEAQAAIGEAVALRRAGQPVDSAALADALERQARLYIVRGLVDSAVPAAREGIALRRAMSPGALLASEMIVLGDLSSARGQFDSAEYYLRTALDRLGDTAAPGLRADIMDNLAAVMVHNGRIGDIEPLQVQALALRREQYPPGHPVIASSLGVLGDTHFRAGRLDTARAEMSEAMRMHTAVLGRVHPYVAYEYHQLGQIAEAQGDFDSSEVFYAQAADIKQSLFGPNHTSVARTLAPWGGMRVKRGDWRGAESLLVRARDIRRAVSGDTSLAVRQLNEQLTAIRRRPRAR